MSTSNPDLLKIYKNLLRKNLQINPFFIKITGSISAGFLLSQLVYLDDGHYNNQEFYKKDSYFFERLHLSEWELRSSKKKLTELGLIGVRHGKGNLTYYTVNSQKIMELASVDNSFISDSEVEPETRIPRNQKRGFLGARNEDSSEPYNNTLTIPNNNPLSNKHAHVDNSKTRAAAVPKENKQGGQNRPYIQIELTEIEGLSVRDIRQILEYPEYLIQDVFRSYRKNRARVHNASKYFLCALERRAYKDIAC